MSTKTPKEETVCNILVNCDSRERQNGIYELLCYLNKDIADTIHSLGEAISIISACDDFIEERNKSEVLHTINNINELRGYLFKVGMCKSFFAPGELPKMYNLEWKNS